MISMNEGKCRTQGNSVASTKAVKLNICYVPVFRRFNPHAEVLRMNIICSIKKALFIVLKGKCQCLKHVTEKQQCWNVLI